jgi:Tfp pilus assembly protein PilF
MGRFDEAETSYRQAVRLAPLLAEVHNNLGNVLQDQQRYSEAVESFAAALRLRPAASEIHFNLGNCYRQQELGSQAADAYRQALALQEDFAMTHQNLGLALQQQQHFDQALACHRRAIELEPTLVEAHTALGVALQRSNQLDQAKTCYQRALELEPGNATAQFNLASALHAEGNLADAETYYRAVLQVQPLNGDSLSGLALIDLVRGNMVAGWSRHEQARRLKRKDPKNRPFRQPLWQGEPLERWTLLVHDEQGFGDTLQMLRYVPLVGQRVENMLLTVQPEIVPLVRRSGYPDVLDWRRQLPEFDLHVALPNLPRILGSTMETIPADVPYLFADENLIRRWQARLADVEGFKVGIHWQGNSKFATDHLRSIPLECFAPLAEVPDVKLVSLQKGPGREQLHDVTQDWSILDLADELTDFHESAAVMMNLDLVITCDSSPAHLAGALGVGVWIGITKMPDWRWFLDREDSPWYPTARLFRQSAAGDWEGVFARMAAELARRVESDRARAGNS